MMTKFVADSSCDILEIKGADFATAPLTISTDKDTWLDDGKMDVHQMLDTLAAYKGRSYSACPSVDSWLQAFGDADEVFVGPLTSGLSGSYNSAIAAREIYLQTHPQAKVHVFETFTTGPELRMLMEKLVELHNAGLSFEEVCREGEAYIKKTHLFFLMKSVHNFAQNGRINKVLASAVGVLGISIVNMASEQGTVQTLAKCRGDKRAIARMLEHIEKAGYRGGRVRISHVENESLATVIANALREKYHTTDIDICKASGLCSYYAERGGILIGLEV